MKILKIIVSGLLSVLLTNLILLLILNCTLKSFLIEDVLIGSLTSNNETLDTDDISEIKKETESIPILSNNELINEALEDKEIKRMVDEFVSEIMISIAEEDANDINVEDIERKMTEYLKNHKEELSSKIGYEITDEMINEVSETMDNVDTKNAINQSVENVKNSLTKEERMALKVFNIIVSTKIRLIIIALILLDIILIALVQKSTYKWIKNLASSMIMAGLSVIILTLAVKYIVASLTLISIVPETIQTIGIITLVFGVILYILYKVMTKFYIKENKNEISKVLTTE